MEHFLGSFPYQSLGKGTSQFRLVSIQPGSFDDPIHCQLQQAELDDKLDYEALSYAWGSPNVVASISLNGLSFPVSVNLHVALRYLRRQDVSRVLWIDAICINRKDTAERSEQVMRMGDIYRRATKVLIWIGKDDINPVWKGSMSASQIFAQLFDQLYHHKAEDYWQEEPLVNLGDWTRSLLGFVTRPWFTRMWVIQESVAHLDAEIICGHASLPWLVFLFGVEKSLPAMRLSMYASELVNYKLSNVATLQTCMILWREWRHKRFGRKEVATRLARLLFILAGTFHSTDPKDRLFAILGLIPGASETLASAGLSVDYERGAADIFRDLAIFLITELSSVDILAAYGADRSELRSSGFDTKPSWVPTWSEIRHSTIPSIALERLIDETGQDIMSAQFRFSEDKTTLFLRGAVLGEIALLGEEITVESLQPRDLLPGTDCVWKERFRRWEQKILDCPLVEQRYGSPEDARAAWRHALFHPKEDDLVTTLHICYDNVPAPDPDHPLIPTTLLQRRPRRLNPDLVATTIVDIASDSVSNYSNPSLSLGTIPALI